MGRRGPTSKHPSGVGSTDGRGYHQIYDSVQRCYVLAHRALWESERGPIPSGHQIHHINGERQDNRIENLVCVTATEHKRIHGGCELREGVWWKPCKICREYKPISAGHWYMSKRGWPLYGRCRPCHIRIVVEDKRARKRRARALGAGSAARATRGRGWAGLALLSGTC